MATPTFDSSVRSDKTTLLPGTVIILQGQEVQSLIMLHSGMAELLDFPGDPSGFSDEEVLAGSLRVGLIKGESVCGVSGYAGSESNRHTIRTISECQVSNLPITNPELLVSIQSKKGLSYQVLRALQQRIESAVFLYNNYKYVWHRLASIADALALAHEWGKASTPVQTKQRPDRYKASLGDYSRSLRAEAQAKKISLGQDWDQNLFLERIQVELGTFAEVDDVMIEGLIDYPRYLFCKRLVKRPDPLLAALFEKDEPSQYYVFQVFSRDLETVLGCNRDLAMKIRALAEQLFGKKGWVEQLISLPGAKQKGPLSGFIHYLWKFSMPCQTDMQKLLDISLTKTYSIMLHLAAFRALGNQGEDTDVGAAPVAEAKTEGSPAQRTQAAAAVAAAKWGPVPGNTAKLKNLTKNLLEFSELGPDFAEEFQANLSSLKAFPDKLVSDPAALAIREKLSGMYWRLYESCYLKVIDSDLKPLIPGIMLHFGLVDETLVTPDQLAQIDAAYTRALSIEAPVPVMTLPYFLEKIFNGEINPSMSEMGESFAELLRRQTKMTPKERMATTIFDESPESKVRYEIRIIAEGLSKLLSGSRKKSLPFLCSENIQDNVLRIFQEPESIADQIQTIRNRDFTLFFRETICKHRFGNDLVRKDVLPNFVLYPVAGTRAMMWQELDGTRKDSAARFFMPAFFTENVEDTIITLLANFRWELSRAVAGHNWMDPVEGGLSGAYYDYITYFRKNPNLSVAHKDTLKEFVARTRSDKDRFAEDYKSWVIHEYESKVRFNPVARDVFYRFCPFSKEIREEMAKKALYMDLETKYVNRARKDILALESRFKKFEKAGEPVPADMQAYMEMLNA